MNFNEAFINALQSDVNLTKSIQIHHYLPIFHEVPNDIASNLPHIEAFGNITASYPYYYGLSRFQHYCLIYTESGAGTLSFDNRSYTLTPHSIAFIDCRETHRIEIKQSPWNYTVFFLAGGPTSYLYRTYINSYQNMYIPNAASSIGQMIFCLYMQLEKHSEKHHLHARLLMDLLFELILEKEQAQEKGITIPEYLIEIKNDFDSNYQNHFSLDALEQKFHVSKYRICREFTIYYDLSPIQYLNRVRIKVAKEALIYTDKRINEVGSMIGFDNTNHFIRLFKQQTGVTPLIFRKQPPAYSSFH